MYLTDVHYYAWRLRHVRAKLSQYGISQVRVNRFHRPGDRCATAWRRGLVASARGDVRPWLFSGSASKRDGPYWAARSLAPYYEAIDGAILTIVWLMDSYRRRGAAGIQASCVAPPPDDRGHCARAASHRRPPSQPSTSSIRSYVLDRLAQ